MIVALMELYNYILHYAHQQYMIILCNYCILPTWNMFTMHIFMFCSYLHFSYLFHQTVLRQDLSIYCRRKDQV